MTLEEAMVKVWREALVDVAAEVELDGQTFLVRETARKRLREVDFVFEGQKLRGLEQNPKTESRWAQLPRAGHKVMQFLSAGRYIGNVVDGKVTIYGGKKKSGTMKRAPGAPAELPRDAAQKERKKDKPYRSKNIKLSSALREAGEGKVGPPDGALPLEIYADEIPVALGPPAVDDLRARRQC